MGGPPNPPALCIPRALPALMLCPELRGQSPRLPLLRRVRQAGTLPLPAFLSVTWIFVTCAVLPWGLSSFQDRSQMLHGFLRSLLGRWSTDEGNHRRHEWAGDGGKRFLVCEPVLGRPASTSLCFGGGGGWKGAAC